MCCGLLVSILSRGTKDHLPWKVDWSRKCDSEKLNLGFSLLVWRLLLGVGVEWDGKEGCGGSK